MPNIHKYWKSCSCKECTELRHNINSVIGKDKLKHLYLHKTFKLGIFGASLYILGWQKFSLRFSLEWGW